MVLRKGGAGASARELSRVTGGISDPSAAMPAANPVPLLADPYRTESVDEEGGTARAPVPALPRPEEKQMWGGSVVEVQLANGVWRRGKLVEQVVPPKWRVQFDDGELREDIRLGNPKAPVRFDASAYGATVEVRVAGAWRRGRLVDLVRGSEILGVAFEDGGWAENVRLGDPDVRYAFEGTGQGAGAGEGEAGVTQGQGLESMKRGRTESGEGDNSGGGATFASSSSRKRPAQEEESEAQEKGEDGSKPGGFYRTISGVRQC